MSERITHEMIDREGRNSAYSDAESAADRTAEGMPALAEQLNMIGHLLVDIRDLLECAEMRGRKVSCLT